jgi:hypothetical protein
MQPHPRDVFVKPEPTPETTEGFFPERLREIGSAKKEGIDWNDTLGLQPHHPAPELVSRNPTRLSRSHSSVTDKPAGSFASLPAATLSLLDGHRAESFAMATPANAPSSGKGKGKRSQV